MRNIMGKSIILVLAGCATLAIAAAAPENGAKIFAGKCAMCHGPKGDGAGKAAKALKPKPTNFSDAKWQAKMTDDQILESIRLGNKAKSVEVGKSMPGFGMLTDTQLKALLKVVRDFGKTVEKKEK